MVSLPTSSLLCFYDLEWRRLPAPLEWSAARVEVLLQVRDLRDVRLTLQGRPLELVLRAVPGSAGELRIVADIPPLNPGTYRFRLTSHNGDATTQVTVQPRKIHDAAFQLMIEELEQRLPVAIARAIHTLSPWAGLQVSDLSESTRARELIRLRRAIEGTEQRPGLLTILPQLAESPHRVLREMSPWVLRDRARRPKPTHLVQAMTRPANLDAQSWPLRVADVRAEYTVDVYENRLVRLFVDQVARRLHRLARLGQAERQDAISSEAARLLVHLHSARDRAAFLSDVALPSSLPTRVTMVLLRRPAYHAALEGYLELHRDIAVRLEEPALDAPLEGLPRLYQVWGVLQVLDALLQVAAEGGYEVVTNQLLQRDVEGFFVQVLPGNFMAVRLRHRATGVVVLAIGEPEYSRWHSSVHSISFVQKPDLSIEIRRPDGSLDLYLFDPKYKLDSEQNSGQLSTRPVKMDIDKMHAYRDALRDVGGGHVVRYAAILYPGSTDSFPASALPEVEALRAYPGETAELQTHLRALFGAVIT